MDSCFPHLAILSPRNASKPRDRLDDECNVVNTEDVRTRARSPALAGKNDVFQDLDLYYVRQIARNSKVGQFAWISRVGNSRRCIVRELLRSAFHGSVHVSLRESSVFLDACDIARTHQRTVSNRLEISAD